MAGCAGQPSYASPHKKPTTLRIGAFHLVKLPYSNVDAYFWLHEGV